MNTIGRITATTAALLIASAAHAQSASQPPTDALLAGFQSPPDTAHPRVWWHWMNGNVSWDGVQKDMEWMKRVGITGTVLAEDSGRAVSAEANESARPSLHLRGLQVQAANAE